MKSWLLLWLLTITINAFEGPARLSLNKLVALISAKNATFELLNHKKNKTKLVLTNWQKEFSLIKLFCIQATAHSSNLILINCTVPLSRNILKKSFYDEQFYIPNIHSSNFQIAHRHHLKFYKQKYATENATFKPKRA